MDQSIRGAVGRELVEPDIKSRLVGRVVANVLREQDAAPQARQIVLNAFVVAGESPLRKQHQVVQKQAHEGFEHVEAAQRGDAGLVELGGAQAAVGAQHAEKDLAGLVLVVLAAKADLGQDFKHRAAFRLDDADIVLRVELAIPRDKNRAVVAFLVRLIFQGEVLETGTLLLAEAA